MENSVTTPSDAADARTLWESVETVSAADALRRDPVDVSADDGTEVVLSPDNPAFAGRFSKVALESFADLQTLGLVPRALSEDGIRAAIIEDDAATYDRMLHQSQLNAPSGCTCEEGPVNRSRPESSVTRMISDKALYRQLRAFHHPALARVLTTHYQRDLLWNDPAVALVHKWVMKLDHKSLLKGPVGTSLFGDITVHDGATFTIPRGLSLLFARDIRIHRQGRIVIGGNYVKIWAASVRSFQFAIEELPVSSSVPWHLP